MRPASLAKRTYLLVTAVVTLIMLVFGYFEATAARERLLQEQELQLVKIVTLLDARFPYSVETALATEDIQAMTHKEHIERFSPVLQAAINEIGSQYPSYGLGYGGKQMLAVYPPNPGILELPISEGGSRALQTKELVVNYSAAADMWNGAPTLSVVNPHLVNGKVVGFSWANVKLEDIYHVYIASTWRTTVGFGSLWLATLFVLHLAFRRVDRELQRFNDHLKNYRTADQVSALAFTEMSATLDTVEQLRQELFKQSKVTAEAQQRLQAILEQSPVGVVVVNTEGTVEMINSTFKAALSREADDTFVGQSYFQLLTEYGFVISDSPMKWALEGTTTRNHRMRFGGREWVVNVTPLYQQGQIVGALGIYQDNTDLVQKEQQMAYLDRLNMVGEMAAGIGHEVRNPMTTVRGYLQLLKMKEEFQRYQSQFTTMIEEIDRANGIITEFLSLAKNKTVEMQTGNLNNVTQSIFPLLQADAFQKGHDLQAELSAVPDMELDQKEIRQLILNLVRNGLEAMEQQGKVVIRTFQQAGSTLLQVQDNGPGIPEEIRNRLGTPFVTTKENGTGLGLAVCYRIADRHGAEISVDTGPDGTTFTVAFRPRDMA